MPALVIGIAVVAAALLTFSATVLVRMRATARRAELRLLLAGLAPSFDPERFSRALARASEAAARTKHPLQPELDSAVWLSKP